MKPTGRALAALFVLAVMLAASGTHGAVTASLDRTHVALGDTLRLTITATDGEDLEALDLQPLAADFDILQRSVSSKTSIINGRYSSSKELLLDITPRREGTLAIPLMRLGKQVTNAIQVVVGPPPQGAAGDQNLVFEAELDRSAVYVQGQVILTLRLQQAVNLDDRSITELQLDNAFVRPLEQNSFQRTINGRPWLVHEVRYAIFPEQSGTLEIPAQTFSARERTPRRSLFDIGGGGRQVRRQTQPLTIDVLPRPDSFPGDTWLPAREISLEESWSTPPEQLRVGESATRTITIRGEGLQGAQLPPVLFPATDGLKYYPDQPVISDAELASGLVGSRVDSVAVVPTRAGRWQIPELRIPWWDTDTNELRYAVLPGREIEVAAAATNTATATPAPLPVPTASVVPDAGGMASIPLTGDHDSRLWQIAGIVNGVGWLLTLAYLVWSRRKSPRLTAAASERPGEHAAFKTLLSCCTGGDAPAARRAVIEWAGALLSRPGLASSSQVATVFDDPSLTTALAALDAALYRDGPSRWDGAALAQAAKQLRKRHRKPPAAEPELRLYPRGA